MEDSAAQVERQARSSSVVEFKDKIGAAGGKVEFLYEPGQGIAAQVSGSSPGRWAIYMVAVSMDGRHLLSEIPATGMGVEAVYPKPSVTTFIQSDEQGMWGRNCPACQKYFRTNHVMGETCCPHCSIWAAGVLRKNSCGQDLRRRNIVTSQLRN